MKAHVDALVALAHEHDPALAAALEGVPHDEIAALERDRELRLPASYRAFLGRMGRASGRFLLARGYEHDFATVRGIDRFLPRYFTIAVPGEDFVSDDGSAPDLCLDLGRGASDAPVVEIEQPPAVYRDGDVHFLTFLTRAWFRCVVLEKQRCGETFHLGASGDAVTAALRELGFVEVLPPLPTTRCLRRGAEDGALVMESLGVTVEVLSRDRDVFDRFPEARTLAHGVRPPRNSR